jgi:hypothetical protein
MKPKKGIEMDYGKRERFLFLEREKEERRSSIFVKLLLLIGFLYFAFHIAYALADTIVKMPDGTVKQCYVTSVGTVACFKVP